jgi:ABC-type amino acid transport substrate-binding protein
MPYLRDDPVVLMRRGLARPTSLAELRPLKLCAERGRRAADAVAGRVRPRERALLVGSVDALLRKLQTGACDAGLAELSRLGPELEGRRDLYGGLAGRIETQRAYAVALERNGALLPATDRALRSLRADGTLRRLATAWLGVDQTRLRVLR